MKTMFNYFELSQNPPCIVICRVVILVQIQVKGETKMTKSNVKLEKLKNATCIIYCRVSSKEQSENTSLDDQERLCTDFAKKYNMKIEKIYKEDASAMKPETRPIFNEKVKKLQNGAADVVIFAFIDRMSRNPIDGYKILKLVEEEGLTAVFVQENLILQAPIRAHEMLMLDTILGVSNYRVRQDREKCLAGIKAKALGGFRPCRPPYGYENDGPRDKRQAVISKKRADFVRKAFELYATGDYTILEVVDKLYELGFRYELQPSKLIPKQSLISMLKNPFYTGKYYVKQADEYVVGDHKAIISEELFEKVQKLLDLAPKAPRKHHLLYSKLLTCANCGHCMTGDVKIKPNGKKYVYYRCTNPKCSEHVYVSEIMIDDDLSAYLKEIRLGLIPDEIVAEVLKDELYAMTQKLSILKRSVSHKYDAERRAWEAITKKDIRDEQYIRGRFANIQEKYGDLDSKIYVAENQIKTVKSKVAEACEKRLYDVYMGFDTPTKRKILELVANIFKCDENGLKMTFKSAFRKIRRR